MADHILPEGKLLIEGIARLGVVLGYHVEKEFPVEEGTYGEPPAVDVAWFSQKGNRFPLFIFEVESKPTNGMTNNPLKIFSQENRAFEKPLFFFHVIAKGGENSSRPRNLEAQYGKNNYRIYLIGKDSANDLIQDVLSQHTRVRSDLDYVAFHQLLKSEVWLDKVDRSKVISYAAKMNLSEEDIIASYIRISRYDRSIFADLIELVKKDSKIGFSNTVLDSYIGSEWGSPVLVALLCRLSKDKVESEHWSEMMLQWQTGSCYLPRIAPSFGLNRDYDDFILGCAPQLITLLIALSYNKGSFHLEFIEVLGEIIDKIGGGWIGLNSAIYLLHISSAVGVESSFNKARRYLLNFRALSDDNLFQPPSCVTVSEGSFEEYFQIGSISKLPLMNEFHAQCKDSFSRKQLNAEDIALRALDDDSYVFEWANDLLEALWSQVVNSVIIK